MDDRDLCAQIDAIRVIAESVAHRVVQGDGACARGDREVGIRGADDDVFSRGYLCPKGYALCAPESCVG